MVVFFVTYVVFEVPSNMILTRTRPSVFLPVIMFIWYDLLGILPIIRKLMCSHRGGVTCCMAAAQNYHHLIVLRILVGVFEAGFAPGMPLK